MKLGLPIGNPISRAWRERRLRRRYESILEGPLGHLAFEVRDAYFANFGYSMPLSLISKINAVCSEIQPELVLEFGSGVSTLAVSNALSGTTGHLVSIDESISWLEKTYSILKRPDDVILICAGREGTLNYRLLSEVLSFIGMPELVIIDGPSQGDRFSDDAIMLFRELLSGRSVCVVDDTDREPNDLGAVQLANEFSLRKVDYDDPIYLEHQYSILFPPHIRDDIFERETN